MKIPYILALTLLLLPTLVPAQSMNSNRKLDPQQFHSIVNRCASGAALDTMLAVATTESALHVDAISLNRPEAAARLAGFPHHRIQLRRQPHDLTEAIAWMNWFANRHYTVSVGLMQINIENAARYGLRPEELFDPCVNVAVGADLLAHAYHKALQGGVPSENATLDAISAYNSGSFREGYANGYVSSVLQNQK